MSLRKAIASIFGIACLINTSFSLANDKPIIEINPKLQSAVQLKVKANDFTQLVQGLDQELANESSSIQINEKIPLQGVPLLDTYAKGLRLNFRIGNFRARMDNGAFWVNADLLNMTADIQRVHFNHLFPAYCSNIHISSPTRKIPLLIKLVPKTDRRGVVHFIPVSYRINLTTNNFSPDRPRRCNVLLGMNWIVKEMLPHLAAGLMPQISASLGPVVQKVTSLLEKKILHKLNFSVDLPLANIGPIPDLLIAVDSTPRKVNLSTQNVLIAAGGVQGAQQPWELEDDDSSQAFIPLPYINELLQYVSFNGVFNKIDFTKENFPEFEIFFTTKVLHKLLPDSLTRFPGDEKVMVRFKSVKSTYISSIDNIEEESATGVLHVEEMQFEIFVADASYVTFNLSGRVPLKIEFDTDVVKYSFEDLTGLKALVNFADDLEPALEDDAFDDDQFSKLLESIAELMEYEGFDQLLTIQMPEPKILGFQITPTKILVKKDGVLMKVQLKK